MRAMLERVSPLLIASVLAGGFVASSAFPAGAEQGGERRDRLHAERPVAAPVQSPAFVPPDIVAEIAEAQWYAGIAEAEWYDGVRWAEAERFALAGGRSGQTSVGAARSGRCNGDVACFLACTRAHESDTSGGYGAVSAGGTYRGAYQFAQPTWDAAVAGAGYGEYAGIPADQAPPEVQDAAAAHLYTQVGTRPWGGRC